MMEMLKVAVNNMTYPHTPTATQTNVIKTNKSEI
jgi:hypothetical protein